LNTSRDESPEPQLAASSSAESSIQGRNISLLEPSRQGTARPHAGLEPEVKDESPGVLFLVSRVPDFP